MTDDLPDAVKSKSPHRSLAEQATQSERMVTPHTESASSHGVGRVMSRREARKTLAAHEVKELLAQRGVLARSPHKTPDLREEIPQAYRDPEQVLSVLERAGVVRRVARLRPRAVLKG